MMIFHSKCYLTTSNLLIWQNQIMCSITIETQVKEVAVGKVVLHDGH